MRVPTNVRVDRHGEAEIVIGLVKVVKVVFPEIFDNAWVDPFVTVGHVLDEHLPRKQLATSHESNPRERGIP